MSGHRPNGVCPSVLAVFCSLPIQVAYGEEIAYIPPDAVAVTISYPSRLLQLPGHELLPIEVIKAVGEQEFGVDPAQPDDLEIDFTQPMRGLGSFRPNGFNVCFADGSAQFLPNSIDPNMLKGMFTVSGGEVINRQEGR